MKYVKVPDDRLNLFKTGNAKDTIENQTNAKISIDENAKTVSVHHKDSVKELDAKRVVDAVANGFGTEKALKLSRDPTSHFSTINIQNMTRNKKEFKRQKGRIIGENGKTKEIISELTGVMIVIYREKVSVIGSDRDVRKAREAIISLIRGKPHQEVYRSLEKYKKNRVRALATRFYKSSDDR
jgi:ribosomal RNA assembly protein